MAQHSPARLQEARFGARPLGGGRNTAGTRWSAAGAAFQSRPFRGRRAAFDGTCRAQGRRVSAPASPPALAEARIVAVWLSSRVAAKLALERLQQRSGLPQSYVAGEPTRASPPPRCPAAPCDGVQVGRECESRPESERGLTLTLAKRYRRPRRSAWPPPSGGDSVGDLVRHLLWRKVECLDAAQVSECRWNCLAAVIAQKHWHDILRLA
jgi:hypothetical protein